MRRGEQRKTIRITRMKGIDEIHQIQNKEHARNMLLKNSAGLQVKKKKKN
jgi:hypothetical protein